jgi:hypothetical protein
MHQRQGLPDAWLITVYFAKNVSFLIRDKWNEIKCEEQTERTG